MGKSPCFSFPIVTVYHFYKTRFNLTCLVGANGVAKVRLADFLLASEQTSCGVCFCSSHIEKCVTKTNPTGRLREG